MTTVSPETNRRGIAVLLYALTGGVLWWTFHLVALSVLVPTVCDGAIGHWSLSAVNGVSIAGGITGLVASRAAPRMQSAVAEATGRTVFLAHVALAFNAISLALVVLESIPVYVLEVCS